MDFVTALPRTPQGFDAIWVIVNRLTKTTHFIPIHVVYPIDKLTQLYVQEGVRLHGVPESIVSDREDFSLDFEKVYRRPWTLSCN